MVFPPLLGSCELGLSVGGREASGAEEPPTFKITQLALKGQRNLEEKKGRKEKGTHNSVTSSHDASVPSLDAGVYSPARVRFPRNVSREACWGCVRCPRWPANPSWTGPGEGVTSTIGVERSTLVGGQSMRLGWKWWWGWKGGRERRENEWYRC